MRCRGLAPTILGKQKVEAQIEEFDIEGAISFARQMLENDAALWKAFPHEQRERFKKVIFPKGVTLRLENLEPLQLILFSAHLQKEGGEKEEMATRHGFEP